MDVSELIQSFLNSEHGQQAIAALGEKGINADDAQTYLGHAMTAAHDHVHKQAESQGLLGDHPGRSFFAAFAAGLVKGDGVMASLEDGAAGVVSAKIVGVLCDKAGLDPNLAETVAATATPYILAFLRKHLGG